MRIAIDVESVLAEPNEAVLRSTDQLTRSEIESTWFSNSKEDNAYNIYMGVSDAVWRHNPQMVAPEEPNLDEYVAQIREEVDRLDILTHRQHVDEQVVWWLAEHDIEYDGFVSTDRPKWEFEYDVFVDDNPNMFGECELLLRHQPWNTHLDTSTDNSTERIHSLAEVLDYL